MELMRIIVPMFMFVYLLTLIFHLLKAIKGVNNSSSGQYTGNTVVAQNTENYEEEEGELAQWRYGQDIYRKFRIFYVNANNPGAIIDEYEKNHPGRKVLSVKQTKVVKYGDPFSVSSGFGQVLSFTDYQVTYREPI